MTKIDLYCFSIFIALTEDEPAYKCRNCDFNSDNAAETNYHMRAAHAANGHMYCSYCPFLAVTIIKLRSGLKIQLFFSDPDSKVLKKTDPESRYTNLLIKRSK